MEMMEIMVAVVLGGVVGLFIYFYNDLVLKPKRVRLRLERQGIRGPAPSFLLGNIPEIKRIQSQKAQSTTPKDHVPVAHDWHSTLFSHIVQWRKQYGAIFTFASGSTQTLCVTDPEMVKQISLCTSLKLGKPAYMLKERKPLFGQGIVSASGQTWAFQKKVISPELHMDKVKGMVDIMVDSTNSMLKSWDRQIDNEGGSVEIRVDDYLRSSTADVIARACFGSSYDQGKAIFLKLRNLQQVMGKQFLYIGVPGYRHLPTKDNRDVWRLEKEINSMILRVIKERIKAGEEKDLMQMILNAARTDDEVASLNMSPEKFMVDNCKNIYFAGHETTATTTSWALMLLAVNPEWQTRARDEVLEICKGGTLLNADMLRNMKTLTMVIQETLRLYPVASFVSRQGSEDIKFKDMVVPKDVIISIPVPVLHHLPELWGPDAHLFNPERFANGIMGACKIPQAYMYFGMGVRTCIGQQMAMVELKVILTLVLSKFSFTLSPAYKHSPSFKLTIEPGHGVQLIVRKL